MHGSEYNVHVMEPAFANTDRLDGVNVSIHKGTLCEFDFVQKIIASNNIKTVVHLVSTMVPGSSYEDYKLEFNNVIFPTVRLMQYCSQMGIKFIYFSSGGTVYGDRKTDVPFIESDPKEPISYYGLSKQMIENSIQFEHRTSGLQYLVLRPSNPYGQGQNLYGKQGLIAVSLGRILTGQPITVWGDGKSIRDYIYIEDLANVFCQLMELGVVNETINVGSGKGYSINDIIANLKLIAKEEVLAEHVSSRKADVSNMILDISKLKSILPNLSLTSLKDGLKVFYETEKRNTTMNENKLLTLCIPTNGVVKFVLPVLESIYSQNVDDSLFEIVITDNGKDSKLETAIVDFLQHGNLFYYKSELQGFVNQVDSFKHSNGLYIKMLNHRAKLRSGFLSEMIEIVKKYKDTQPVLYFSNGVLAGGEFLSCKNFDTFVRTMSFYSSWSAGLGLWLKDKAILDRIEYNQMFPHASILFEMRMESEYVICNKEFMDMGNEQMKGGYNIFHAFAVIYLDILKDLNKRCRISKETFNSVKYDLRDFLSTWYYNIFLVQNQFTFVYDNYEQHILVNYNKCDLFYIKVRAELLRIKLLLQKQFRIIKVK